MTQKDESPNESEGPYWSEELLAVLVVGLGDEIQARETLEGIIQQAHHYAGVSTASMAPRRRSRRQAERRRPSDRGRRHLQGQQKDEQETNDPTTKPPQKTPWQTTSFFLEAIARPSSRKGVTEDDIGWMGPFLQVGGVPGRRL